VRPLSALLIALGALVLASACNNLPHVDPGPRWIDLFNKLDASSALAAPSWTVFSPWTCGTTFTGAPDGGTDGGIADAGVEAGQPRACLPGPGDTTHYPEDPSGGLEAPFAFSDSANDFGFAVSTHAPSGTVDFSGFRQLVFSASLTTPSTPALPGAVFQVELDCTKDQGQKAITRQVTVTINAQRWQEPPFRLDLSQFQSALMSSNGSCLSQIDGIRFLVIPGMSDQPDVIGTLFLDNVSLQN